MLTSLYYEFMKLLLVIFDFLAGHYNGVIHIREITDTYVKITYIWRDILGLPRTDINQGVR